MLNSLQSFFYKAFCSLPNIRGAFRLACLIDRLGPFSVKTPSGVWIKSYLSSTNDKAFIRKNHENPTLSNAINGLTEKSIFIDIGANVGYYSALASRIIGETGYIVSAEPSPREFQRLLWNRFKNATRARWICVNEGAAAQSGILPLKISKHHTGMNTFADGHSNAQIVWAPVNPLSDLVSRLGIKQQIDLIKIDVEGWEFDVLKGLSTLLKNKSVSKLILEITDEWLIKTGSSKTELYNWMRSHGYKPLVNSSEWQYDEVFVVE